MGYWLVTVQLRDGRKFANVAISNDWRLGFPDLCPFRPTDIVDVEWDGPRRSSSGKPVQLTPR